MNEPTLHLETRPEIVTFVQRVRDRLADLGEEDREELVGGLEADLHELVADGGSVSELGDPRAYADELRAAAGVPKPVGRPRQRAVGAALHAFLDEAHARWDELMRTRAAREAWAVLGSLRGAWWVLRAWVAVQLLAFLTNNQVLLVPEIGGQLVGGAVLAAAVVGSVQLGRGKLWLSSDAGRPVVGRVLLLALNVFALLMVPLVVNLFAAETRHQAELASGWTPPGLANGDTPVRNVFPYDAQGRPLEGVQLFDQDGNPLVVGRWAREWWDRDVLEVAYPWSSGEQRLYNVFPLPMRDQHTTNRVHPDAWATANPPALPRPPLVLVPPVELPVELPAEQPVEQPTDKQADSADRRTR